MPRRKKVPTVTITVEHATLCMAAAGIAVLYLNDIAKASKNQRAVYRQRAAKFAQLSVDLQIKLEDAKLL